MFSDSEYFSTCCVDIISTSFSFQPFLYDPGTEIYIAYDDPKSFGALLHVIRCGTHFPWQLPRAGIFPKLVSSGLRCLKSGVIIIAYSSMPSTRPCYDTIIRRLIRGCQFPMDLYSMAPVAMIIPYMGHTCRSLFLVYLFSLQRICVPYVHSCLDTKMSPAFVQIPLMKPAWPHLWISSLDSMDPHPLHLT